MVRLLRPEFSLFGLLAVSVLSADSASASTIRFDNLGTFTTAQLALTGLTVSGSADVNVSNFNGLGIVGGSFNNFVDGAEFVEFLFTGGPAINVSFLTGVTVNLNQDQFVGSRVLQAFDAQGNSLGSVAQNGGGTFQVSTLFANAPISRLRITADLDGFIVNNLSFDTNPVPEPANALLLASGVVALALRRAIR